MSTQNERTQAPAAGTDRAHKSPAALARGEDTNLPTAERVGGDHENTMPCAAADQNSPVSGRESTPGPWFARLNESGMWDIKIEDLEFAHCVAMVSNGCPRYFRGNAEANARLLAAAPKLLKALIAISTHPHINLGDLVYSVREAEGEGWEGPQVTAWSSACEAVKAAIAKATGKEDA